MNYQDSHREKLEEEVQGLKSILNVAQVVVSSLELDEVLQNILCSAMAIMDMPAGSIALYEEGQQEFSIRAHAGLSDDFLTRNRWGVRSGGFTHRILEEGGLFVVEDTRHEPFFRKPAALREGILSMIAAPLKFQEKIVGVIYLNDFQPRRFSSNALKMLSVLASFATMSIDNARLHACTWQMASTDALTGLYNYRMFRQMVREELTRTARYCKPMSLILFDVDDFKKFNDDYGHPAGDRALAVTAEIMRDSLRECDLLFRYGGEEFIALLPETGIEEALTAAERTRKAMEENTPELLRECAGRGLTVSIGVASYPRDGHDLDSMLQAVDSLLYMAKRGGKNKVNHLERQF